MADDFGDGFKLFHHDAELFGQHRLGTVTKGLLGASVDLDDDSSRPISIENIANNC